MVSMIDNLQVLSLADSDPCLQAVIDLIEGNKVSLKEVESLNIRERLLLSIANSDERQFKSLGDSIGERSISPNSEWCHDDFLVFLLLLGNQMFNCKYVFIQSILDVRRSNGNALPQKINEVFVALYRKDYSLSGEMAFVKLPFLSLIGELQINTSEAKSVYTDLINPNLYQQLSPFFKVLAHKAFESILFDRADFEVESVSQLISLLGRESENLNFKHIWNIVFNLPLKLLVPFLAIVFTSTLILYSSFQLALSVYEDHKSVVPYDFRVKTMSLGTDSLHWVAKALVKDFGYSEASSDRLVVITSESTPNVGHDFVIEVSTIRANIKEAVVYIQHNDSGATAVTVVPVQNNGNQIRVFVPEFDFGGQLVFAILLENSGKDIKSIKDDLIIRPNV